MSYKAVLFDLDGTLLDTLEDLANAMNTALAAHGFPPHHIDKYRIMVGDGATRLAERAVPPGARRKEIIDSVLDFYLDFYAENWNVSSHPYEGVMELLETLEERRIQLAVLSNKPDLFTRQCVRDLLPGINFKIVWGERDGVERKPDPSGAIEIARIMDVAPSEFLYVGDTATDMLTAVGAGMYPVGALWGFRTADELKNHGAKLLLSRPLDLLNYVT